MGWELKCECKQRIAIKIDSIAILKEIESFFEEQQLNGIFSEIKPDKPYYSYKNKLWYADRWYKCNVCGCLWEVVYPDFPAKGFVRKFDDGKYIET